MNDLVSLQAAIFIAGVASILSFCAALIWTKSLIKEAYTKMEGELKRVCAGLDAEILGISQRVRACERQLVEHNYAINNFNNVVSAAIPDIIMRTNRAAKQINILADVLGTIRGIGAVKLGNRMYDARVAFPIGGDRPVPRAELKAAPTGRKSKAPRSRETEAAASPKATATPRYRDPVTQRFVKTPVQTDMSLPVSGEEDGA